MESLELNPYRAPDSTSGEKSHNERSQDTESAITETELVAFTGGGKYPPLLLRLLNKNSRHAGLNVWAAIFGIQWFFFRKLYLFGLFSAALELSLPLVFVLASGSVVIDENRGLVAILGVILLLVIKVSIGYMANIALCLKASKVIEEVDLLNKDNETHLRLIARAGGVSLPSLLGIYVAMGVIKAINSH